MGSAPPTGWLQTGLRTPMVRNAQVLKANVSADWLRDFLPGSKEHMGLKAELTAKTHKISREEQDDYTIESYRKALKATKEGLFRTEIAPIKIATPGQRPMLVREDESLSKV